MELRAILPKKSPLPKDPTAHLNSQLKAIAAEVLNDMQTYPPWLPWKSTPPRTGLRAGGRRTGSYGRGWHITGPSNLKVIVANNDIPYAVYVGGPRSKRPGQATALAARGWRSIETEAEHIRKKYGARVT